MKKNSGIMSVLFALLVVSAVGCGSETDSQPVTPPGVPNPNQPEFLIPDAMADVGSCIVTSAANYLNHKGICMDFVSGAEGEDLSTTATVLMNVCSRSVGAVYVPHVSCDTTGVDAYCIHTISNADGTVVNVRRILMSEDSPEAQQACESIHSRHGTRVGEYHGRSNQ